MTTEKSKSETARTTRMLRDHQLDAVSGGNFHVEIGSLPCQRLRLELENTLISG